MRLSPVQLPVSVRTIVKTWVDTLTPEQQEQSYNEIVDYFTEKVTQEVLSKYYNSVDFDSDLV